MAKIAFTRHLRAVAPSELASKSRNTPFAGFTLPARVVATFLRGTPTVLEVRLSARLTHIFIVQGDGSVLHWRQTP